MSKLNKYGPDNPHTLSTKKTELVWEGKYDEYGNRREVDIAGCAMPMQKIETIDEPASRLSQTGLFDAQKAHKDDFRNMLIWGDNKLVMASLLKDFKGKIDLICIDPPFDVGADFTMDVPIGDSKESIGKDQSTLEMVAYRDMWGKGTDSYLHIMYERLALMKELLIENGSIFVHCDWRVNSYLRVILLDVPLKAMAADSWCKAASSKTSKWEYLYVPQTIFSGFSSNKIEDLVRTCAPSLAELLTEKLKPQLTLPLGEYAEGKITGIEEFISSAQLEKLPSRYKKAIEQAVALFQFFKKKEDVSFAPVFTSLLGPLDESAKGLISDLLLPLMPGAPTEQKDFFEPYYEGLNKGTIDWLRMNAKNLEKTLVFKNGLMPIGLLKFCLEYCQGDYNIGGVFEAVKQYFSKIRSEELYDIVKSIYDFRNTYIAHQDKELTDIKIAKEGLAHWVQGLYKIYMSHH